MDLLEDIHIWKIVGCYGYVFLFFYEGHIVPPLERENGNGYLNEETI